MSSLPMHLQFLREQVESSLRLALEDAFREKAFMTTAFGPNGIVLLDIIRKFSGEIPVVFLNTGYHFPETLALKDYFVSKGVNIKEYRSRVAVEKHPLHEISKDFCCATNKVEVMEKVLASHPGWLWISAISRDQTRERSMAPLFKELPDGHYKLTPMIGWRVEDVWQYIHHRGLRYNPLHDKGYPSIGCEPCTSKVSEGESDRAGRWRGTSKTECGLHNRLLMHKDDEELL